MEIFQDEMLRYIIITIIKDVIYNLFYYIDILLIQKSKYITKFIIKKIEIQTNLIGLMSQYKTDIK